MALTLFLKRSKIFLDPNDSEGERRWMAMAANAPVQAPDWVAHAPGFAAGIKDGSITNLTPPKAVPAAAPDEEPATLPEIEAAESEDDSAAEESAKPKRASRAGAGTVIASAARIK